MVRKPLLPIVFSFWGMQVQMISYFHGLWLLLFFQGGVMLAVLVGSEDVESVWSAVLTRITGEELIYTVPPPHLNPFVFYCDLFVSVSMSRTRESSELFWPFQMVGKNPKENYFMTHENYGPINKVLLRQSHTPFSPYCLWLLLCKGNRVESL